VLLDFWATWCGPCRLMSSSLGALQSRYAAQGVRVVGLSTEDEQRVASFARRTSMPYPVASDQDAETSRAYGIVSLPTVVVIDRRGVVRDVAIGYDGSSPARLERVVQQLLAEP
ncbi:MAG TPA: TlpA disulfide reductase family protein, partial [Polyangiaceae bacterium]|nr:TlpA disulfide reductase family protein [Polyangiaceae bacterium]